MWPGAGSGQRDGDRGDQVGRCVDRDHRWEPRREQQRGTERPPDQPHGSVVGRIEGVRAAERSTRADDRGYVSLHRGHEDDGRGALDEHRHVHHPRGGVGGEQQRDGGSAHQVGADQERPTVHPIGQDACERAERQGGQVLGGDDEAGRQQRVGRGQHLRWGGDDQQPVPEAAHQVRAPQQPEVASVQMLGQRLRALRAAAGRTVASVAADAGLSVPYIANLENGRGNPTLAALDRLARALGTELSVDLGRPGSAPAVAPPTSLVRLARTERFRRVADELAGPDRNAGEVAAALIDLLARVGPALGVEPDEVDRWRLLDALLLVGLHSNRNTGAAP